MKQKDIKRLLESAANDAPANHITPLSYSILCSLTSTSTTNEKRYFARKLYTETIENRPELLPSLLPAFILFCGDDGEVDWSLVD